MVAQETRGQLEIRGWMEVLQVPAEQQGQLAQVLQAPQELQG